MKMHAKRTKITKIKGLGCKQEIRGAVMKKEKQTGLNRCWDAGAQIDWEWARPVRFKSGSSPREPNRFKGAYKYVVDWFFFHFSNHFSLFS